MEVEIPKILSYEYGKVLMATDPCQLDTEKEVMTFITKSLHEHSCRPGCITTGDRIYAC